MSAQYSQEVRAPRRAFPSPSRAVPERAPPPRALPINLAPRSLARSLGRRFHAPPFMLPFFSGDGATRRSIAGT